MKCFLCTWAELSVSIYASYWLYRLIVKYGLVEIRFRRRQGGSCDSSAVK